MDYERTPAQPGKEVFFYSQHFYFLLPLELPLDGDSNEATLHN